MVLRMCCYKGLYRQALTGQFYLHSTAYCRPSVSDISIYMLRNSLGIYRHVCFKLQSLKNEGFQTMTFISTT